MLLLDLVFGGLDHSHVAEPASARWSSAPPSSALALAVALRPYGVVQRRRRQYGDERVGVSLDQPGQLEAAAAAAVRLGHDQQIGAGRVDDVSQHEGRRRQRGDGAHNGRRLLRQEQEARRVRRRRGQ